MWESGEAEGPGKMMDHLHAAAAPPCWTHPQNWWATPIVSLSPSSYHIHKSSISFPCFLLLSLIFFSVFLVFLIPVLSSIFSSCLMRHLYLSFLGFFSAQNGPLRGNATVSTIASRTIKPMSASAYFTGIHAFSCFFWLFDKEKC